MKQFLQRLLLHNVIESKGGVAERLRRERLSLNSSHLLAATESTIESVAIEKAKAKIKAVVDGDEEALRSSKRK